MQATDAGVMDLTQTHESIVVRVVDALDLRSRTAVMCTCSRLKRLCERPELWRRIIFDSADEQRGVKAEWLLGVLNRAEGCVEVLHLARSREARDAEGHQRFSDGLKMGQLLPHTQAPGALALAAMCPRLRHLSIDERASCLGGMTNALARALGARCPLLESLEVYFERYSLPSELLTDEGLIALSEGCRRLSCLVLVNCDYVSDRSLYAVAANCRGLRELQLGGYSENITDGGLSVLVESCPSLVTLWLSGRLLKVTDTALSALSRGPSAATLRRVKLTRSMTSSGALRLLRSCAGLREVDARHCRGEFEEADVAGLARACPRLSRVVLPRTEAEVRAAAAAAAEAAAGGAAPVGIGIGAGVGAIGAVPAADEDEEEGMGGGVRLAPACSLSSFRMLGERDVRRLQGMSIGISH